MLGRRVARRHLYLTTSSQDFWRGASVRYGVECHGLFDRPLLVGLAFEAMRCGLPFAAADFWVGIS